MIVKTETLVDGVAEVIHAPFALLRRLGVAPAAAMSPGDLRGNAQLLSQGVLGVLWQTARRAPPWEDVSRAWEASARAGHVSSPDLCGAFDPADRVRVSRQQYRASVQDHVNLLLAESLTGSVFLWHWGEADVAAKLALRVVVELERRGFRGPGAVERFQRAEGGLKVDGFVGPETCKALGIIAPREVVWRRR